MTVPGVMGELEFEWDGSKDRENRQKHRVSFEEAKAVFSDDFARLILDPDHSVGEERFILLGMSARGRLLVVCHCNRGPDVIRIISAREASRPERRQYEDFRNA